MPTAPTPTLNPFSLRNLATVPLRALRRICRQGPLATAQRAMFLARTAYREWRLGIRTEQFIPWDRISDDPCSVDYEPTGYRTLDRALALVTPQPGTDVFLDYGCGQGRALVVAARQPFAKVMGIELSEELCVAARQNLNSAAPRLQCLNHEVIRADAQSWPLPDEVTVVFLFNPFRGPVLESAIRQIGASLKRRPRNLKVLYVQPLCDVNRFAEQRWLRETHCEPSEGLRLAAYEAAVSDRDRLPVEASPLPLSKRYLCL